MVDDSFGRQKSYFQKLKKRPGFALQHPIYNGLNMMQWNILCISLRNDLFIFGDIHLPIYQILRCLCSTFLLVWIVSFFHWIAPKRGPGSFHGKRCEKQLPQTLKVANVAVDASDISTTSDKAPRTPWYICQISCCSLDLVYQFQRCCQFV